jgi:Flp pilus assembly protein TadD
MAAPDFRICPNCGTRNKKGWEYCARCGEDLHAVPMGASAVVVSEPDEPPTEGSPWLGLVGAIVFVAVAGYASSRIYRPTGAVRPSAAVFEIPTLPASTLAPLPDAVEPGRADYEEGRRLLGQGDAAGAAQALARAVQTAPDNAVYRNAYAKTLLAAGGPLDEVVRQHEEAMRLSPRSSEYVADLARAYDRSGRTEQASRMYDRALELAPTDAQALREVSSLHARAGHPEAALPYLKRLSALSPEDLVVQQELGVAAEKAGDAEGAKQAYRTILDKAPQAAVTRGLFAEVLLKEGKSDEAVALLRTGIDANPSGALLHRTLASALERSGNVAEAVREYREYARLDPTAADAKAMEDRAARLEARVAQSS